MALTARDILGKFGVITDGLQYGEVKAELNSLLGRLAADAQGDATITDGHPRSFAHTTLMGIAGDELGHQDLVDQATTDAAANEVRRTAIDELRSTLAL